MKTISKIIMHCKINKSFMTLENNMTYIAEDKA
jgi:hypothetical protein